MNNKTQKPILVIIHIYYHKMWIELKKCIKNISPYNYELFVTISKEDEILQNDIMKFNPQAKIEIIENKGLDTDPFVHVLNKVNLDNYSYITKLHTKNDIDVKTIKNNYNYSGKKWRQYLLSFISSKKNLNKCINSFEADDKLGMVANYRLIAEAKSLDDNTYTEAKQLLEQLNLPPVDFSFVAGTMFIARAELFKPLQKLRLSLDNFTMSEDKYDHYSYPTHTMERFLGWLIEAQGYKIQDTFSPIKEVNVNKNSKLEIVNAFTCNNTMYILLTNKQRSPNMYMLFDGEKIDFIKDLEKEAGFGEIIASVAKQRNKLFYCFPIDLNKLKINSTIKFYNNGFIIPFTKQLKPVFNFGDLKHKGLFAKVDKNKITFKTKKGLLLSALMSLEYSIADKINASTAYFSDKKYSLYGEKGSLKSDNSFSMFKHALQKDPNSYFITDINAVKSEQDSFIKSHLIKRNSIKHKKLLLRAKNIISSWGCDIPGRHKKLKDIHYSIINPKWHLIPHGVTAGDKDSVEISKFNWGNADNVFVCSPYEKEAFEKLGYESVQLTGYPRSDKWGELPLENKSIVIFFTWRRDLANNLPKFKESGYFEAITELVEQITKQKPDYKIYFFVHNSFSRNVFLAMMEKLQEISENIEIIATNGNQEAFNEIFDKCQHFITDYTSAAFDFAYRNGRFPIYYLNPKLLDDHYHLLPKFFDIQLGVTTETPNECIRALDMKETPEISERKKKFFKYFDRNNSGRAYEIIYK